MHFVLLHVTFNNLISKQGGFVVSKTIFLEVLFVLMYSLKL